MNHGVTLTLTVDTTDLDARYVAHEISPAEYALHVVTRSRVAYPVLAELEATDLLRLVPGLPEAVTTALAGETLAALTTGFLSLGGATAVTTRMVFPADLFGADAFATDEELVLKPHADPAHPGHQFVAWLTELSAGDLDDRTAGPWFAATPQAALVAALDEMHQFALGEPSAGAPQ